MNPPREASAEPEASGVQGAQVEAKDIVATIVPSTDWKAQETFSDSLRNINDGRRLAAGALFTVAAGGVKMLEDQLLSASADRKAADARERDTLERYYQQKEKASVSNARLEAAGESSRLRSVMQNLGSVLLGAAITLFVAPCPSSSGNTGSLFLAALFGLVGLIFFAFSLRVRWSIFRRQT
jgi:hypothetical protein